MITRHSHRLAGRRWVPAAAVAAAAITALVLPMACSSDGGASASTAGSPLGSGGSAAADDVDVLRIVASFYPLQFVADSVGGDRADVANLTPAGAEPHDLELTGDDTASLQDSDLVVFLSGFTPALDEAAQSVAGDHSFDVAGAALLDIDDIEEEGDDQNEDGGGVDPHFWLDPTRLADVADAIASRLSEIDPDGAATFTQNAATLRTRLKDLDAEFAAGLADCSSTDIVTSHSAFGYLAQRYGLTQVGITGLSPDEEPSPGDLARVAEFVSANDVQTIYYETLVDPGVAETVADETGASAQVLDPIEGVNGDSQGADYFEIMRSNLANLRAGQGCA